MLRSNRVTQLARLTLLVAFGTLLYATYLYGEFKGHGSIKGDSFGDLNSTIPPKITPHRVEEWNSSRFLKGRPTKLFRGVWPVLWVVYRLIQFLCR